MELELAEEVAPPSSQDPRQRVVSQVNLAELPGTAGSGTEETRQILHGAFPALVSLFILYSRVGSECATLEEAVTLGLEGFRKLLKDAPSLGVVAMGDDAMSALFARCLTGQPQPQTKMVTPAARQLCELCEEPAPLAGAAGLLRSLERSRGPNAHRPTG